MRRSGVAALAGLLAAACGPAPESSPSIVLISIDTIRADFTGCGGAPEGTTPVLDRLARRGLLCANALQAEDPALTLYRHNR